MTVTSNVGGVTRNTVPSQGQWSIDVSATLRHRIKQLPVHAQAKLEYLDRVQLEAAAKNTVAAAVRAKLAAEYDDCIDQVNHLERHAQGWGLDTDDKRKLAEFKKASAEALAKLKKFDAAKRAKQAELPPREERRRLAVITRYGADIFDWIMSLPSGQRFKPCVPELKLRAGQSLEEALAENRSAQLGFADEVILAERAPLDVETALMQMRRDVAALAATGAPDIAALFRLSTPSEHRRKMQGSIKWPVKSIATVSHLGHRDVQLGNAMLAWMFRDQLTEKLEAQIRAKYDPSNCLSEEERGVRVKDCEEHILNLQRLEEQIVVALEKQGHTAVRQGGRNPLAILEIEPDTAVQSNPAGVSPP